MASCLSEQQRLEIEEKRQRALALRAARQQQQALRPANSCQSVTDTTTARPPALSRPLPASSASTSVSRLSSTVFPRTTAKYSNVRLSGTSSWQPKTLSDSSNRAPAAAVSCSKHSSASHASVPMSNSLVHVKCCLVSRQQFAADSRYFAPLVEVFKSISSKQYGDE